MNVNAQKFQSLYALVGNRWHGGTIGRHSLSQPLRAASSLREGAGNGYGGLYHSTGYSLNRKGAGDFHRPYEGRFPFIEVHSLSLAFARQLPQRGSRGRVRGRVPFNQPLGNRKGAGDFHRPYENSEILTFHHSMCRPETVGVAGDFHRPYERRFPFIEGGTHQYYSWVVSISLTVLAMSKKGV